MDIEEENDPFNALFCKTFDVLKSTSKNIDQFFLLDLSHLLVGFTFNIIKFVKFICILDNIKEPKELIALYTYVVHNLSKICAMGSSSDQFLQKYGKKIEDDNELSPEEKSRLVGELDKCGQTLSEMNIQLHEMKKSTPLLIQLIQDAKGPILGALVNDALSFCFKLKERY